nr:MAG TPA: hypothetical protein [Caudoviricetes sp.]
MDGLTLLLGLLVVQKICFILFILCLFLIGYMLYTGGKHD